MHFTNSTDILISIQLYHLLINHRPIYYFQTTKKRTKKGAGGKNASHAVKFPSIFFEENLCWSSHRLSGCSAKLVVIRGHHVIYYIDFSMIHLLEGLGSWDCLGGSGVSLLCLRLNLTGHSHLLYTCHGSSTRSRLGGSQESFSIYWRPFHDR